MGTVNPALSDYRSKPPTTHPHTLTASPGPHLLDILTKAAAGGLLPHTPTHDTPTPGNFQDPNVCGIKVKQETDSHDSNKQSGENISLIVALGGNKGGVKGVLSSADVTKSAIVERTPIQRGGQSAPSKLQMARVAIETTTKPTDNTNLKPSVAIDTITKPTDNTNLKPSETVVDRKSNIEVAQSAGGGRQKVGEVSSDPKQWEGPQGRVGGEPSAEEVRKLRQAQQKLRKEEWQKKHGLQRGVGEGVVKEENCDEGYDLNELVSEGN